MPRSCLHDSETGNRNGPGCPNGCTRDEPWGVKTPPAFGLAPGPAGIAGPAEIRLPGMTKASNALRLKWINKTRRRGNEATRRSEMPSAIPRLPRASSMEAVEESPRFTIDPLALCAVLPELVANNEVPTRNIAGSVYQMAIGREPIVACRKADLSRHWNLVVSVYVHHSESVHHASNR